MQKGNKGEADTICWSSPGGTGFKIRGKTYLQDNTKHSKIDTLILGRRCLQNFDKDNVASVVTAADKPNNIFLSQSSKWGVMASCCILKNNLGWKQLNCSRCFC